MRNLRERSSFGLLSLSLSQWVCDKVEFKLREYHRGSERARERCADARRGARGDYANERPICWFHSKPPGANTFLGRPQARSVSKAAISRRGARAPALGLHFNKQAIRPAEFFIGSAFYGRCVEASPEPYAALEFCIILWRLMPHARRYLAARHSPNSLAARLAAKKNYSPDSLLSILLAALHVRRTQFHWPDPSPRRLFPKLLTEASATLG